MRRMDQLWRIHDETEYGRFCGEISRIDNEAQTVLATWPIQTCIQCTLFIYRDNEAEERLHRNTIEEEEEEEEACRTH